MRIVATVLKVLPLYRLFRIWCKCLLSALKAALLIFFLRHIAKTISKTGMITKRKTEKGETSWFRMMKAMDKTINKKPVK